MAIEPKLVYSDGSIGIEDTWLQTNKGLEKLTLHNIGNDILIFGLGGESMSALRFKSQILILLLLLPLVPHSNVSSEDISDSNNLYSPIFNFYPFDGAGHHPVNGDFNKVGSDLSRISPSSGEFEDDYISRANSPSSREISNILCQEDELVLDANGLSDFN